MSTWQFDASAANDFVITGVLACLDGYMNIALEQTEEYVNGQLKNKYGDAFIRGNNGKYILVVSCTTARVSRPPVLDYGTTFHLDSGGRVLPLTLLDNL